MDGYKENPQGALVPMKNISEWDLFRDQIVGDIFNDADKIQQAMHIFKKRAMDDVIACVQLAAEKYGKELGGQVGNVSLTNFDGTKKVQICISQDIDFDERIVAAKAIIFDCVKKWTADSNSNVIAVIEHAFKTNKDGKLSASKLLGLFRIEINDDEDWTNAMRALKDSIQIVGRSSYLRFYTKEKEGKFKQLPLDISSL